MAIAEVFDRIGIDKSGFRIDEISKVGAPEWLPDNTFGEIWDVASKWGHQNGIAQEFVHEQFSIRLYIFNDASTLGNGIAITPTDVTKASAPQILSLENGVMVLWDSCITAEELQRGLEEIDAEGRENNLFDTDNNRLRPTA